MQESRSDTMSIYTKATFSDFIWPGFIPQMYRSTKWLA